VRIEEYDNKSFLKFPRKPQEDWVKCRWISVNGLSRDIIGAVGEKYGLHELALEDLVWTRNRTKAEWYALYLVLRHLAFSNRLE
jgi:Mg2+ and Co2+ transporter CorA